MELRQNRPFGKLHAKIASGAGAEAVPNGHIVGISQSTRTNRYGLIDKSSVVVALKD